MAAKAAKKFKKNGQKPSAVKTIPPQNYEKAYQKDKYNNLPHHIKAINILAAGLDNNLLSQWQKSFTINCLSILRSGHHLSMKQAQAAIRNAEYLLPTLQQHKIKPNDVPYHRNKPIPY